MNILKNIFIPTEQNNFSPIVTKSLSIFTFALVVMFFNLSYGNNITSVHAAVSINDIVTLQNRERESRGLKPLMINIKLNNSALAKANAMMQSNCWSHYCPDGKSPWDFFDDVGYRYTYAGENLAHGFSDNETAMAAWMNSPTHRENVLKPEFREVGIGIAYGEFQGNNHNIVIVVHFGTRTDSQGSNNSNNLGLLLNSPSNTNIISPKEGIYTNDNKTHIIGSSARGQRVEVYNNGKMKGEVSVNGGLFTYRPQESYRQGPQLIVVKSFIGSEKLGTSDVRKFTVDITKPFIKDNKIISSPAKIDGLDAMTLSLKTNEKVSVGRFIVNGTNYEFLNNGDLVWDSTIPLAPLNKSNAVGVELVDLAGNKTKSSFRKKDIIGLLHNLDLVKGVQVIHTDSTKNIKTNFLGLSKDNLKSQVNIIFILISIGVILIDMLAVRETGLTGFAGKSHLHLASFAVIILVILIGGLNGHLIDAISI